MPQPPDELLDHHLRTLLGDVDEAALQLLHQHLEWVVVAGGQTLMTQGDPGDSMYLAISGRLRAYVTDDDGGERMVREMARGQIIGEMSLYTDAPCSASVVAIRDSVLVRLGKTAFKGLLAGSSQVSIALTRQIIRRLQNPQQRSSLGRPVVISLVPVSAGVDARDIAERLALHLGGRGLRVHIADAAAIDRALQQPGLACSDMADDEANRRMALHLDERCRNAASKSTAWPAPASAR